MKKIIKEILKYLERNILSDKLSCSLKFRMAFGRWIDWEEPKSFEEKIQWRKIYGMKEIYTTCSDRYYVREYIKNKIGAKYLIPLLFQTKNPSEINFEKLHTPFIIKTNNNEGEHRIVFDKREINEEEIINYFSKEMKRNRFWKLWRENQYKFIEPRIIIERLMVEDKDGKTIPNDYKFHCFNGKPKMIQVDINRFGSHKRCILDMDWKIQPFTFGPINDNIKMIGANQVPTKPKNFKKMIEIVEKLAKDFDYVRVDIYNINNKIYFGELTFTPCGGFEIFYPKEWDYHFGELWEIDNGK